MLSAVLMLGSCSKSNDSKPKEESCKVESVQTTTPAGDAWSSSYTYDNQNRVKKTTYNSGDYETYTYQSDKITLESSSTGTYSSNAVYNLDSKGRIVKITANYGTTDLKYNNDGYLSELKFTTTIETSDPSFTRTFEYAGGNLNKVTTQYDKGDLKTSVYTISYSENSADEASLKIIGGDYWFTDNIYVYLGDVANFLGKGSKNLISKIDIIDTDSNGGSSNFIINYTYQKDAKGNITSMKETQGTDERTYNFTYTCK